jgi:rhodanese-related sulfurtransferase
VKKILAEAVLVTAVGAALAFAANELSTRGLKLTRNYFPGARAPSLAPVASAQGAPGTNQSSAAEAAVARLREKGLQVIDEKEVTQLFHDPRYDQGPIIFIDARNDEHYREGHIPGAYQLDRYHPENYLAAVLPACQMAEKVVVYCTGGDCEDSEFAALLLRDSAGVAAQKLFVFTGGMTEWTNRGLPIEEGGRKSGQMRAARR